MRVTETQWRGGGEHYANDLTTLRAPCNDGVTLSGDDRRSMRDRERVDYLTVDSLESSFESFPLIRCQRIFEPRFIDPAMMKKRKRKEKKTGVWGIKRMKYGLSTELWVINIDEYMYFNRFDLPGVGSLRILLRFNVYNKQIFIRECSR